MDWTRILANVVGEFFSPLTAAYAIAAIGLNIHFGLTGLLNMGQAGFMLIGAYGFAITTLAGGSALAGILVGLVAAVVFSLILGVPTLRLRGDYLAIVTIAAAEIVRLIARSTSMTWLTGGNAGIAGDGFKNAFHETCPFPSGNTTVLWWTYPNCYSNSWWLRIVAWVLVGLFCLLVGRLMRSPWGRVLKGIREDEDAVRSLGKNVYAYKMQALILGGVVGALGGVLWAHANAVQPDSMGRPTTFWIWTLLLLGGAATIWGPVLGSILFWVALVTVRNLAGWLIPESMMTATEREPFSLVLVGVTLMCLVVFRPQGLLGNRRELVING
jgi:neutral amino acid transport system permease protein